MERPQEGTPAWQQRTGMIVGSEGLARLQRAHALVVGLGGVGAVAAEMLVRAGLGRITIVDADTVQHTNINRQILALRSTVGRAKAHVLAHRLRDINPELDLTPIHAFMADEPLATLASARYDVVLDAIDTLSPKIFLIKIALEHGNPVVSSMGAGARLDPTRITVGSFWEVRNCPLASTMRKRFRRLGFQQDFAAVYSTELPLAEAVMHDEQERNKKSRVGSMSYITAIFGAMLAAEAIRSLRGGLPFASHSARAR